MINRLFSGPLRQGIEAQRPLLYRVAYAWCHDAALADDLAQEALSKAWARRDQLRETAALKGWLVSIMNHCWLDHLRARRDFEDVDDLHDTLASNADLPEVCCDREQLVACVRAAVATLPLAQRQVLTLVDLEEFGYAEVARILEIPVGTVMSRLSRARAALKLILERKMRQAERPPVLRRVK